MAAVLGAGLALAIAGHGHGVAPAVPPGDGWEVESVMLLDPQSPKTYALGPPFRVTRDGEVIFQQEVAPDENGCHPHLLRLDLVARGQRMAIFARAKLGPVGGPCSEP